MKIDLYLEEFHVKEFENGYAVCGKRISRKYLTSAYPNDGLMSKAENKFKHLIYFNDLRIFKFNWKINKLGVR